MFSGQFIQFVADEFQIFGGIFPFRYRRLVAYPQISVPCQLFQIMMICVSCPLPATPDGDSGVLWASKLSACDLNSMDKLYYKLSIACYKFFTVAHLGGQVGFSNCIQPFPIQYQRFIIKLPVIIVIFTRCPPGLYHRLPPT